MAIIYGSQIDLQKIPVKGIVPESGSSAPSSPVDGQLWFNTSTTPHQLQMYVASIPGWVQCDNQGTGGGTLTVQDENATVGTGVTQIDFQGAGVAATLGSGEVIVTVSGAPTGSVPGGDLTGSYPSPTIGTGKVTSTHILDGTIATADIGLLQITNGLLANNAVDSGKIAAGAVDTSKIVDNTILVTDLSLTSVRLDNIGLATAAITANGQFITNVQGPPSAGTDAANKAYVDSVAQGLDVMASVRLVLTSSPGTYAAGGSAGAGGITAAPNTVDGITLAVNNRVLVAVSPGQQYGGIWQVTTVGTGANGVWTRPADFKTGVTAGAFTFVEEGNTNKDTGWVLINDNPVTIDSAGASSLSFTQFTGVGAIVDGIGLLKTGNTLDVRLDNTTVETSADIIQVKDLGITNAKIAAGTINLTQKVTGLLPIANGGTNAVDAPTARANLSSNANPLPMKFKGTFPSGAGLTAGVEATFTHNLGSTDVDVTIKLVSNSRMQMLDWRVIDANSIGITADVTGVYGVNSLSVVVIA